MKITEIITKIQRGYMDEYFLNQYIDSSKIAPEKTRYTELLEEYKSENGDRDVCIIASPGRTEIGGNHTDHQHGVVLAGAINSDIVAVVEKTDNGLIEIKSDGKEIPLVDINNLEKRDSEKSTSEALIKGVLNGLQEKGYKIGGFKALANSEVLVGSGLSSSAAFENLIGTIVSHLYNEDKIDPVTIAKASQYAEREYYGKPCGLMDQMASAMGGMVKIDFKDPENPKYEQIELDLKKYGYSLCIVDTRGSHENLTHEYAAIPDEMRKICRYFGKEYLRDVDENQMYAEMGKLREEFGDRAVLRCIHFFQENRRVENEVQAIKEGDFEKFKFYFKKSANSSFKYLQNIYSHSDIEHQALSLGLAVSGKFLQEKGVARVHGGGFAGTIQAFVEDSYVETYKGIMEGVFGEGSCQIYQIKKGNYQMNL